MNNYYQILGLNQSATNSEIRRAYRVLARRYHPDVNPGKDSENRFKIIAEAYSVLSDDSKRTQYDSEFDRTTAFKNFAQNQRRGQSTNRAQERYVESQRSGFQGQRPSTAAARPAVSTPPRPRTFTERLSKNLTELAAKLRRSREHVSIRELALIEISLSVGDAIHGVKKTVEITEGARSRKVSVRIPPGVRTGSIVRMRAAHNQREELIMIVRVAPHPFLQITARGLVVEVPITISEALFGASISVPTVIDPVIVKVRPGTQSGSELRIKGKGILEKDSVRGDLFLRFLIRVPGESSSKPEDPIQSLDEKYQSPRSHLPESLSNL